jgi:gluconate 2-dehydrogenase gamma chain
MAKTPVSRRDVLSRSALVGSLLAFEGLAPARARSISGEVPWTAGTADAPKPAAAGDYQFFTRDEVTFIDAAVARLIPKDERGPGAKEAGVTVFLDRQLAGPYGAANRWYMQGPWQEGAPTQGFQARLPPAQIYRAAIKAIDEHCRDAFQGKRFSEISAEDQDRVLSGIESGDVDLGDVKSKSFFEMFLQNTIEGFFSDPIYGGNRDMVGWKLIGFPGARYDYREYVAKHGQRLDLPPVGLKGRPGWTP